MPERTSGRRQAVTPVGAAAVRPAGETSLSLWLDAFRWMAAACVLLSHAQTMFVALIVDVPAGERTIAGYGFAFLAGFGTQAVVIFFVLSGYLVGGPLLQRALARQPLGLERYAAKRVLRLGVVMWPSLLLAWLFASIALQIHAPSRFLPADIGRSMSVGTLACNVAFLQTGACDTFAGNGPLWSLYNEFWYYMVWPALLVALRYPMHWAARSALLLGIAGAAIALGAFQAGQLPIVPYMLIWILGAAAFVWSGPPARCPAWLAGIVFVGVLLAVRLTVRRDSWMNEPSARLLLDFPVALGFSWLLVALRRQHGLRAPPGGLLHRRLAGCSYSLYCTHVPTLMLLGTWLFYRFGIGDGMVLNSAASCGELLGVLAVTAGIAYGFSRLTEAHTDRVRHWLLRSAGRQLQHVG